MTQYIRKATTSEIINHWILAVSFFVLTITGFGFLFRLEWMGSVFGSFHNMRTIHNWSGVVFLMSLFATMFYYLPVALSWSREDIGWIKKAGGYLSKKAKVPPQDIINAGQKLFYLFLLLSGIVISASGLVIWLMPGERQWILISHLLHNIAFDLLVIIIPVHIYLGTLANPGTLRIMIYGTVPVAWARKRHAKWLQRLGY
ncbi:MAG: formate dehydrogenase subunit gamma [Thermodesulfovibrionales bacterium]|nr:formate dehydrogenase subunit gamma [Thermodesulfovibrionales bacterium]